MSRSYSTFGGIQPCTDGRKKATYTATAPCDHVQHPVVVDAEGRQMPILRNASCSIGETCGIKTEKIVEHSTVPASFLVAEYRYSSEQPGKEELFRDYGVENWYSHRPEKGEYTHLDSAFDRPEKVEEFITKVVNEAGRSGRTRPGALPWHSGPNRAVQENTRKYGDERDFRGDDRKKLNGNWDMHNEPYLNKGAYTHPMIGNNRDFYERPPGNEGPNARNHPLSKPTNDIGSAMEFLKESIKPSYGNGKEKEFNTSAYNEASRPTMAAPLSKPWQTSSNMSGPDTKTNSKDYDSEQEEETRDPHYGKRDELKVVSNRGGVKPFQNKDGYEKPKGNIPAAMHLGQTRFPGSTMQKKKQNTYPEKIDREARRRYGNSITSTEPMMRYNDGNSITSREAMMKYNGALVP